MLMSSSPCSVWRNISNVPYTDLLYLEYFLTSHSVEASGEARYLYADLEQRYSPADQRMERLRNLSG